jgi:Subtilase family
VAEHNDPSPDPKPSDPPVAAGRRRPPMTSAEFTDWLARRAPQLDPAVAEQVRYIAESFSGIKNGDPGRIPIADADRAEVGIAVRDRGVDFMYAEGQILVRSDDQETVTKLLAQHRIQVDRAEPVIIGVVLLYIQWAAKAGGDTADAGEREADQEDIWRLAAEKLPENVAFPFPVLNAPPVTNQALEYIDTELGEDIATPNHILTVADGPGTVSGPCPATEPEEVYYQTEPNPGPCAQNSGEGVLIYIADTGLLQDADQTHAWLGGVTRADRADGTVQAWDAGLSAASTQGPDASRIEPYVGHGTFVAGVARCMAPGAEVIVSRVFRIAGSTVESDLVKDLNRALKLGVDVFNLSVASPTRKDKPLLTFQAWLPVLALYQGVVCVVAAGNDGSSKPTWPSAFAAMLSVGALGADWRNRATFSNYGGWVDVYAPGRDLVNAYATGTYICYTHPYTGDVRRFWGMAKWSGTSFSTPLVAGLVAARMRRASENGQQAAAGLLALARARAIPGVGPILLPCETGACGPACGQSECCHPGPGGPVGGRRACPSA